MFLSSSDFENFFSPENERHKLTTNIAGSDWSVAIRALTGISAFIRITQALGVIRASIKSTESSILC